MDTHISTHHDIASDTAKMSVRLPGEVDDGPSAIGVEAGERAASSAAKPVGRRRPLLAGVAVAALAIAAGGTFLMSPYNHVYLLPHLRASANSAADDAEGRLRPILAPSASLAKVSVPTRLPATHEPYAPKSHEQEVAELLSLHPSAKDRAHMGQAASVSPDRQSGTAAPSPSSATTSLLAAVPAEPGVPSGYVPREPGSSAAPPAPVRPSPSPGASPTPTATVAPAAPTAKDATALIIASLSPTQPAPATDVGRTAAAPTDTAKVSPPAGATPAPVAPQHEAQSNPGAEPAPTMQTSAEQDALAIAGSVRAGPMTPPEQIQVLNLVTEMAAMVKDLRKQQSQLRADLGKSATDVTARLTDYERRLALAEARSGVAAADEASGSAPAGLPIPPADNPQAVGVKPTPLLGMRPVAAPAPILAVSPKVYRVQAASPGLALLAQVDRGGGDGAQLQVVVGDTVPDYGRVKSIAQKGTAWVVTTEHGAIQ